MFPFKPKKQLRPKKLNLGMTYIELIVVLSIFALMSSVVIFNYGDFQAKIDVQNLASDITLKIVEAQKSSLSGVWAAALSPSPAWKPSYGVHFNDLANDNKSFIYFADLDENGFFDGTDCASECIAKSSITQNRYIEEIRIFYYGSDTAVNDFTVSFSRPDSSAKMASGGVMLAGADVDRVEIKVASPKGARAVIKLYPSGRVDI